MPHGAAALAVCCSLGRRREGAGDAHGGQPLAEHAGPCQGASCPRPPECGLAPEVNVFVKEQKFFHSGNLCCSIHQRRI